MTPDLLTSQRPSLAVPPGLLLAARIVRDAAEMLAEEARESSEVSRYLRVSDRLSEAFESKHIGQRGLILASPALTESSGRTRSLVEMIEAEPGDDAYRLRLAKILFRALIWRPETFPGDPR